MRISLDVLHLDAQYTDHKCTGNCVIRVSKTDVSYRPFTFYCICQFRVERYFNCLGICIVTIADDKIHLM